MALFNHPDQLGVQSKGSGGTLAAAVVMNAKPLLPPGTPVPGGGRQSPGWQDLVHLFMATE